MCAARARLLSLLAVGLLAAPPAADAEDWMPLFNGRDLDGWTVKIRGHETGDNYADTFRVEDGLLTVSYDGYGDFDNRFGHIFYDQPFSHYRLRLQYRFIGEPAPGAPEWAYRNSGAMLHAQPPATMGIDQDFPISVEFQFLGGLGDGQKRPTGSICSPGTHVVYRSEFKDDHCLGSRSPTFEGEVWVTAEALVLGAERIVHYIDGAAVMEYGGITTGGGVVSGHRPELKPEGQPLASGHIALQSEGAPIQFRRVELLNLKGCTDPAASNYRDYFKVSDPSACH